MKQYHWCTNVQVRISKQYHYHFARTQLSLKLSPSTISTTSTPLVAAPNFIGHLLSSYAAAAALLFSAMLMTCWWECSIELGPLHTLLVLLCAGTGADMWWTFSAFECTCWGRGSMLPLDDMAIWELDGSSAALLLLQTVVQKSTRLSLLSLALLFWNQIFT